MQKIELVTLSTERPVLIGLDLYRFVLLLTHYMKTSDRKTFAEILKKLMPSYGSHLIYALFYPPTSVSLFRSLKYMSAG